MVWEPELCSQQPVVSSEQCLRVHLHPLICARCAPAVTFYLAPLCRGAWEAQPPGWAPKEQDLPPLLRDGSVAAWGRETFAHIDVIPIPAVPEIIPPENKDNNIYWAEERWRLEVGKLDTGVQQSPRLSKHVLLKEISSSFEILFPRGGERQGTLLNIKSFAIWGGFGFLYKATVWHRSFLHGIKNQLFSWLKVISPFCRETLQPKVLQIEEPFWLCFVIAQSSFPLETPNHKKIAMPFEVFLPPNTPLWDLWVRGVKQGWRNWSLGKFKALLSTISDGLWPACGPSLSAEGQNWGNENSVDEMPWGPRTLGKALQAQRLRHIAQALQMKLSS